MSNLPTSSTPTEKEDGSPSFGDIDVNENSSEAALARLLRRKAELALAWNSPIRTVFVNIYVTKVAAPQPTAELVEGEDHSKKFTFCGRVVALSSVEGTTGKGDITANTISRLLIEHSTNAILGSIGTNKKGKTGVRLAQNRR
ncbi:hypothetical protein QOT17_020089 [Balamuthia mandrillaris]